MGSCLADMVAHDRCPTADFWLDSARFGNGSDREHEQHDQAEWGDQKNEEAGGDEKRVRRTDLSQAPKSHSSFSTAFSRPGRHLRDRRRWKRENGSLSFYMYLFRGGEGQGGAEGSD